MKASVVGILAFCAVLFLAFSVDADPVIEYDEATDVWTWSANETAVDDSLLDDPCECPEPAIIRSMELANPEGELSHLAWLSGGEAYFKLFAYIGSGDSTNLLQDIIIIDNLGIKTLTVFINSGGGSAYDGLALADTISYAKGLGFKVTTIAFGTCMSAAVPVFASGDVRIAMPSTQFMVHMAKMGGQYGGDEYDLGIAQDMLKKIRLKYQKILVDNSNLTTEEWKGKIRDTTFFGADEAKEWGLVHEIK